VSFPLLLWELGLLGGRSDAGGGAAVASTAVLATKPLACLAGSRIVERLLACGHKVHVLCRPRVAPGPEDMLQYLKVSP
jgi:hypothetical protein